jgi:hypothetical protein
LLLTLLQFKNQNFGNLFETHGATMLLFIMAVLVYAIALAGISKPTPNTSYIPILMHVCFIFGASACGLLLLILVTPFGWLILSLCACMFVKLLCDSHGQILEILCGWFQNSLQSLRQAVSRALNRCTMPAANSTKQQVVEMEAIKTE